MVSAAPQKPPLNTRAVTDPSDFRPSGRAYRRNRHRVAGVTEVPRQPTSVIAAIQAAAERPSWYGANFASTAGQAHGRERRTVRWSLRALNRRKGVSALPRGATCGMPLGAGGVAVKRGPDGTSHTAGVETCSSIWACPVCAAKIRATRADEISRGLATHITAGGGALMVTLTLPHQAGDALKKTVELVSSGFRAINSGRAYKEDHDAFGILGHIRAFEVTHGQNGWHPHLHVILALERPASRDVAAALESRWQGRWDRWLVGRGWPASVVGIGVRVDRVRRDAGAAGAYLAKLQEGDKLDRSVGNEVARADLKGGRHSSRVPFEILADFGSDGVADDLQLWQEFQLATKGRSAIRWSRGLRTLLLPEEEEQTDEEVAAAEVGGEMIALLAPWLYRKIAGRPYGEAMLHVAAEDGGIRGIVRFVRALGLDVSGVMQPETSTDVNYISGEDRK
jgi:hypothetical protein